VRRLAIPGVAAAAMGLAAALYPDLVAGFSMPSLFLSVVGGVAVLEGLRVAVGRARATTDDAAPLPVPERRDLSTVPGVEFDRDVELTESHQLAVSIRENLRERLRTATHSVLTRYEGLSEEEADRQIREGEWTDDRQAAVFFGRSARADVPLGERLRLRAAGESVFGMRARRVVDALERRIDRERER